MLDVVRVAVDDAKRPSYKIALEDWLFDHQDHKKKPGFRKHRAPNAQKITLCLRCVDCGEVADYDVLDLSDGSSRGHLRAFMEGYR